MTKKEQHAKVCKELGIDPATIPMIMDVKDALKLLKRKVSVPKFNEVEKRLRNYYIADWSLITIAEAMNLQPDGKIWIPDYTNTNERKYQPYWWEVKANAKNPASIASYRGWMKHGDCRHLERKYKIAA